MSRVETIAVDGVFARRFRPCAVALMLLSFGGCAGPIGTIRSAPPPPAPVTSFDGTYRTAIRPTSSFGLAQNTEWCDTPGQPVVTIANGRFTYMVPHPEITGSPAPIFVANMAADGSFYGESGAGLIAGQIQGMHIQGQLNGAACIYSFSGQRT